jgi:hypothetical protein
MTGIAFTRAALKDATFRARLAEAHWRLLAQRAPGERLEPFAPLVLDLEEEAKRLLGQSNLLNALAFLSAPR